MTCALCGLPARDPLYNGDDRPYCCPSCRDVAALLADTPPEDELEGAADTPTTSADEMTIYLGNLWCASCTWLIGETLRRVPGVLDVQVSFVRRQARVLFDANRASSHDLVRPLRRLGYQATTIAEEQMNEAEALFERLLVAGVFVMHIMLISAMLYARELLGMSGGESRWLEDFFRLMLLLASVPVLVLLGWPVLRSGAAGLLSRQPNMHALIALGALAAWGLSARNMLAGVPHVYFDTAAMLLFLVTVGRWLEARAQERGEEAIERLRAHLPTAATWISPDGPKQVSVDDVRPGMRLLVRSGEHVPADGVVASGAGEVDESLVTGEPLPRLRGVGEMVLAGTRNVEGHFEMIVQAVGPKTAVGHMVRLLHEALWSRSPAQRLADHVAAVLVPGAVVLAALTFLLWQRAAGTEVALMNALSVLLITCPCALGIATPLALWRALGEASTHGVLVRDGGVIEQLAGVRSVFFDKTGTITGQSLEVQDLIVDPTTSAREVWAHVAALEAMSHHPVAEALRRAAATTLPLPVTDRESVPGSGVRGAVNGRRAWVGNARLAAEERATLPSALITWADQWHQKGALVVYVGWDRRARAAVALAERLRADAVSALSTLRALGLQVSVLSGDPSAEARWKDRLPVPVHAGLTPHEKVAHLRAAGPGTLMVGDGANDGPALAAADVGVALGQATDVAHSAADVILLTDRLNAVAALVRLARATRRTVRQNLAWAFAYNAVGLSLAVAGQLHPLWAALAMVLSSTFVTANAMHLRWPTTSSLPLPQVIKVRERERIPTP
ncbi:MAG: cation-translocating P-type ATPase [Ardenticatenia bacterium]|nr:cation-translocating P-type ATPase [Ardenticatenia bacterium]